MLIKELLHNAIKYRQDDLQALIMFLVFEKEALSINDDKTKLDLYFLPKHQKRMNAELTAYKRKMNINDKPNGYKVFTYQKETLYISAMSKSQVLQFVLTNNYDPIEIQLLPNSYLMATGKEHETIEDLMEKEEVPYLLGSNDIEQQYNWRNLI